MLRHRSYIVEGSAYVEGKGLENFCQKHGIQRVPHPDASIGFSEKEQKWYGWSHRAIYGFGIGFQSKEGDSLPPEMIGKTVRTLDDAKKMAIEFSKDVS